MEAKKKKKLIIWGIIVAVVIILLVALFALKSGKSHDMMLNTEPAKLDSIEVTVTATGEIQPVYKVDVGTQVSGKVEKLYVDFNSICWPSWTAPLCRSKCNSQRHKCLTHRAT